MTENEPIDTMELIQVIQSRYFGVVEWAVEKILHDRLKQQMQETDDKEHADG